MAQYRKTFFSMGGPERIPDPGVDEAARIGALLLQKQAQAQQAAQAQQRMTLEERLALEEGRRSDARLAAEQASRAQQAALAERGFGLDERRFAEQQRGNLVGEAAADRSADLARRLGEAGLGYKERELGLTEDEQKATAAYRLAEAGYRSEERTREAQQRAEDLRLRDTSEQRRLEAAAGEGNLDREAREKAAENERQYQTLQHKAGRTEALEDQVALREEQAKLQQDAALRAAIEPTGAALSNFNMTDKASGKSLIPDDPATESGGLKGILPWGQFLRQDPTSELAPIVDQIDSAFAAGAEAGANTPSAVRAVGSAIRNQMLLEFQRAFQKQKSEVGFDNSQEQARLYLLALQALQRVEEMHMARVSGAPGPQAPNAPRMAPPPRPVR